VVADIYNVQGLLPPAPSETAQAGGRRVDCSSETVNQLGNCPEFIQFAS
jgi:hypothetical protein